MNITQEQLDAAKAKQLQDAALLAGLMEDPENPEEPHCIGCQ